ncbi:MAG: hypothetical protein HC831_08815 [Chloroflexia bacterium]|nr:hypothetical protein [Chloroflexia bacterium]
MRILLIISLLLFVLPSFSQNKETDANSGATIIKNEKVYSNKNLSNFDDSKYKALINSKIRVFGEVEEEVWIDTKDLPFYYCNVRLGGFPNTDLEPQKDTCSFNGAYRFAGYALQDLLKEVKLKKVSQESFRPVIDCYIIVRNDKGESAVFSWGEIFFAVDPGKIILATYAAPILPTKRLYNQPELKYCQVVAANDYYSFRNIEQPTSIEIVSFKGYFPGKKGQENIGSPTISLKAGKDVHVIDSNPESGNSASYVTNFYGLHMGFRGFKNYGGYFVKDYLANYLSVTKENIQHGIFAFAAADSYRATFSFSELFNRADFNNAVLVDYKGDTEKGRYTIHPPYDFLLTGLFVQLI